jgi:hypothetical protein
MFKQSDFRKLYIKVLNRLPSTYPQPKLVIHSSIIDLRNSYWDETPSDYDLQHPPIAWCDMSDTSVHVALTNLRKEDVSNVLFYYLHEIGHLYAYKKYGLKSLKWKDRKTSEKYADDFAARWTKKLIMEDFYNDNV